MDIKMIVADLDHTLLRGDKTVSAYTADVLRRVRECGVLLAFATARDFRFVTEYITPLTGIRPDVLIADNGALARYNSKDLYKKMIPSAAVNALMPRFKHVRCVSTENAYFLATEYARGHWSSGKKAAVITDFAKAVEDDAFYLDGRIDVPSLRLLLAEYPDIRSVAYSDVDMVTIVHREATKLNALIAVATVLHISMDRVAAFGDDYSDVEMLAHCKHGVAVANAIDECKAAAKYICDTNENDGVAKWVAQYIL